MNARIEVRQLRKQFGSFTAVDGISFRVDAGQVLGFLGPNGAGKSTTMKMITGFLPPTTGDVSICGLDIARAPVAAKMRIGYLPEGAPLYAEMTPCSFLGFIANIRGLSGARKRERIATVVEQVQLQEVWNQPIETLSKGYKRRVGLAQAILHDPDILVLDEPTDGLDPNQKFEVRTMVRSMAAGKAIIISTHILEEVDALCNRAMIIGRGRVLADGTPRELLSMSDHYGAYTLRVPASRGTAIEATLRSLDEVRDLARSEEADSGIWSITVFPATGVELAEILSGMIHAEGWPVLELRRESGRLDDVFRKLTTTADGGAA